MKQSKKKKKVRQEDAEKRHRKGKKQNQALGFNTDPDRRETGRICTDPNLPRGRAPPGHALGSVRSDRNGGRGGGGRRWAGSAGRGRSGDAPGSIPGASSSPRLCGVNDECRARLLLEDLGDPALGTGTRGGRAPARSYRTRSHPPRTLPQTQESRTPAPSSASRRTPLAPLPSVPKDPGVRSPPTSGTSHPDPFLRLTQEPGSPAPSALGTRRPSPGVRPRYLLLLRTHHTAAAAATKPAPYIPSTNPDSRPAQDKPDPPLPSRGGARLGGRGVLWTRRARGGAKGQTGRPDGDPETRRGTETQREGDRDPEKGGGQKPRKRVSETRERRDSDPEKDGQETERGTRNQREGCRNPEKGCQRPERETEIQREGGRDSRWNARDREGVH